MGKNNKITITEIIWLFTIGGLFGFVLETIWYLIKNGILINKQGLLYGPFKPIYGFGLIIVVILMARFKDKKLWFKFVLGVLIGSAFEYFGSVFQEYVLGTSTWDYSKFNFNIGGRLYLPYCLAWGLIAIFCIDYLYPWFKRNYNKIPVKIAKVLTIVVGTFMIFNLSLSSIVTYRYAKRAKGIEASGYVFKLIDKVYTDEYMQKKFPKLQIVK